MKKYQGIMKYVLSREMIFACLFALLLCASNVAIEYMKKGLKLCSSTVIPSLFPLMVVSELLVSSGLGAKLSKLFKKPMKAIFNLNEESACAYILGILCGFPLGAKSAVSMYDNGLMSKSELSHILTFCNNPGSAFLISAVGISVFGNHKIGVLLYICVIISSCIIGFIGKFLWGSNDCCHTGQRMYKTQKIGVELFTNAVTSCAHSMLVVCAYIVFFSTVSGCICSIIPLGILGDKLSSFIFGFFELSGGIASTKSIENRLLAAIACGVYCGWSGMSVHFQILSSCSGRGISFKPYFISKAAQAIICGALSAVSLIFICPELLSKSEDVFLNQSLPGVEGSISTVITGIFIVCLFPGVVNIFSSNLRAGKKARKF